MAEVTLVLEAAAEGSVAVLRDRTVVHAQRVAMRGVAEDRLFPAVVEAVAAVGGRGAVTRVVCGAGPGSFTSLRVAAGVAKGVCAGAGLPLFAVPSLALAIPALAPGRHLVTLDALRGECYAAIFDWDGRTVTPVLPAQLVQVDALPLVAGQYDAVVSAAVPVAEHIAPMLDDVVRAGPVDRGQWEPAYGRLAEAQVRWEATHGRPLGP
jgi:tRNA threonylcarbamoyladenosine biosynthesis protein TsaB